MSPYTVDKPKPRIPLQPNPFASTALQSAWGEVPADVPTIHEGPFRTILRALKQLRLGGKGTSIVVTGDPGSGKTHLLGRLRRQIEQDVQRAAGETIYIYVRCNASAATLWRHLRLSLASDLLKSGSLDRLLSQRANALDQIDNFNLTRVLGCVQKGSNLLSASAWLRGESLPEADLAALGIKAESEDEDRGREWEAKLITHALLKFVQPVPTVLCFDQVEGLETYPGEQAGFHVLGQLISELHSNHNHLLFLSCLVSDFEDRFEKSLSKADKDRVFQEKATLAPIEWEAASQIVRARLDAAPELGAARRAHSADPWWPLDPDPLRPLFAATGRCLPRTFIQACRQQFDACMSDDLSPIEERRPVSLADFLQEHYEANLAVARRAAPLEGADKILGESLPWLLQNSGFTVLGPENEASRFSNLAYRGPANNTALVFRYARGNGFTNTLKRAERWWKSPTDLKILSDPSIQLKEGAVGAKILTALKTRGAQQIYPLPEALAALHAIRNLTTSARSGELMLDERQITEQEATEWALANLAPQVEQLRADLLQKKPDDDPLLRRLSALLAGKKVTDVGAAARELSLQAEEVTACARRHPMHFGLLEGPPMVLFEAVEGPPPETPRA